MLSEEEGHSYTIRQIRYEKKEDALLTAQGAKSWRQVKADGESPLALPRARHRLP